MLGIKQRHRGEAVLSKKTRGRLEERSREEGERERRKEEIGADRAKGLGGV